MGRTIDIHYNNVRGIDAARELKLSVLLESDSFFYWVTNELNEVLRIEQVDGTDLSPLFELQPTSLDIAFSHQVGYLIPESQDSPGLKDHMPSIDPSSPGLAGFHIPSPGATLYLPTNGLPDYAKFAEQERVSVFPIASCFFFPEFVDKSLFESGLVHLHFMEAHTFISVYRGSKLLLWQAVPLDSAYELQYFTLLVYHQFHMDRKEIPLLLSGRISAGSQLYHLLYPYFSRIQWAQFIKTNRTANMPDTIPSHYLADLWLIHQCAS